MKWQILIISILFLAILQITFQSEQSSAIRINETLRFIGDTDTETGTASGIQPIRIATNYTSSIRGTRINANDLTSHLANFSSHGFGTIENVWLIYRYYTEGGYGCAANNRLQIRNDSEGDTTWLNIGNVINDTSDTKSPNIREQINNIANIDTWSEIKDLDVRHINCDSGAADDVFWDYIFVEVEFTNSSINISDTAINSSIIMKPQSNFANTSKIKFTSNTGFNITRVIAVVGLNSTATPIAQLNGINLTLTSPSDTTFTDNKTIFQGSLSNGGNWDPNATFDFSLNSNFVGENATGEWTLNIYNNPSATSGTNITYFKLRVYGFNISAGGVADVIAINISTPTPSSPIDLISNTDRDINFTINITNSNGLTNLDDASFRLNITFDTNVSESFGNRTDFGCGNNTIGDVRLFNCSIIFPYYASSGVYTINASIYNNDGTVYYENKSTTLTINALDSITLNISRIHCGNSLAQGSDNNRCDDMEIKNSGNQVYGYLNWSSVNLTGASLAEILMPGNFTVNVTDSTQGQKLIEKATGTQVNVTNSSMDKGINVFKRFFTFVDIPSSLSNDDYNSSSNWIITAVT